MGLGAPRGCSSGRTRPGQAPIESWVESSEVQSPGSLGALGGASWKIFRTRVRTGAGPDPACAPTRLPGGAIRVQGPALPCTPTPLRSGCPLPPPTALPLEFSPRRRISGWRAGQRGEFRGAAAHPDAEGASRAGPVRNSQAPRTRVRDTSEHSGAERRRRTEQGRGDPPVAAPLFATTAPRPAP